jgi:hypothetical protein
MEIGTLRDTISNPASATAYNAPHPIARLSLRRNKLETMFARRIQGRV